MSTVQGVPLYSTDNTVLLIVQGDGNLVLCVLHSGQPVLCHTPRTHGAPCDILLFIL